jgi:hypothetical protein
MGRSQRPSPDVWKGVGRGKDAPVFRALSDGSTAKSKDSSRPEISDLNGCQVLEREPKKLVIVSHYGETSDELDDPCGDRTLGRNDGICDGAKQRRWWCLNYVAGTRDAKPTRQRQHGHRTSEYSPGDRMRDSKGIVGGARGSTKGASEYSPGDRMHDKRTKDKY